MYLPDTLMAVYVASQRYRAECGEVAASAVTVALHIAGVK